MCLNFSIRHDIKFDPIKSVYVVFKPKSSKLYCPNVRLDCNILEYISCTLSFTVNMNSQEDNDMLRHMRTLYIRSKKILRTFIAVPLT